jgi:hypothetical protein
MICITRPVGFAWSRAAAWVEAEALESGVAWVELTTLSKGALLDEEAVIELIVHLASARRGSVRRWRYIGQSVNAEDDRFVNKAVDFADTGQCPCFCPP